MLKVLSPEEMQIAMEQSIPALLTAEKRELYFISKEQEQNLRKLVIGLERLLPTHEDKFDMVDFADNDEEAEEGTIEHPCESSACAVGYGPSCGIPFEKHLVSWNYYSAASFGGENYNGEYTINDFMFSSHWDHKKNQMREAIARIKIVLAGEVPEIFDYTESYVEEKQDANDTN